VKAVDYFRSNLRFSVESVIGHCASAESRQGYQVEPGTDSEVRLFQESIALFVDNLPRLADGVINRGVQVPMLVGADEANALDFTIDFTAYKARGAIPVVFVYGFGFDSQSLVLDRFRGLRISGCAA
jgi:hypothetical protein